MSRPSLGALHRLAPSARAATPEDVAASLVALHSTDPASVHLAVAARTRGPGVAVADVDRALYDDRTIVRTMAMRRTMWAVPARLVPVVAGACGRAVAADERRKLVRAVEDQGIAPEGEPFVADLEERALAALDHDGMLPAELAGRVPALAGTVRLGGTSKWATEVGLASRIVLLLTCEGRIVRTRPLGGWTSTRHRYAVAPPCEPMETADARAELARLWMASFGPLSTDPVNDLRWWAGWTMGATKEALASAAGEAPAAAPVEPEPWAALLPSLDPTTMGWKQRSWYLGDLTPLIFDRNGNAGPTVWWCDRIVGGWAQRPTGEVVTRLLLDVGREGRAAVEAETARMQTWLDAGGAVVKPRFPTPLQKELSA